jgi:Lipopolysaccharide kinase (Kdo/WaaP) family
MMRQAERLYFVLSLAVGWLLRSARYSKAHIVGEHLVHKHRSFYAPLLIWLSGPLVRILDTGVRVLPQREWEERERSLHQRLYGASVRVEHGGMLILPRLPGETLAVLLKEPVRKRAIELAAAALAEFHRCGFTHGDAMAENVLVDLETGSARWFDFETVHEPVRPMAWRRADDLRALLATCLVRTAPGERAEILRLILDVYASGAAGLVADEADEEVTRLVAASFTWLRRRSLPFHLAQAPLSFRGFQEIARLLEESRSGYHRASVSVSALNEGGRV